MVMSLIYLRQMIFVFIILLDSYGAKGHLGHQTNVKLQIINGNKRWPELSSSMKVQAILYYYPIIYYIRVQSLIDFIL
jgi:hypothetical protein